MLWSDSNKLLIGTRNMIAREKGGWSGVEGRGAGGGGGAGEKYFP